MTSYKTERCVGCHQEFAFEVDKFPACANCKAKYPDSLMKACGDDFDYAMGLRDGTIFRFESAEICGDWVHLDAIMEFALPNRPEAVHTTPELPAQWNFERGVDVRISDIVWCVDAPQGS